MKLDKCDSFSKFFSAKGCEPQVPYSITWKAKVGAREVPEGIDTHVPSDV